MSQQPTGRPKNTKPPDKRPARGRYWMNGNLCRRKIRNLVRSGMTVLAALEQWESTRKRNKGAVPSLERLRKELGRFEREVATP